MSFWLHQMYSKRQTEETQHEEKLKKLARDRLLTSWSILYLFTNMILFVSVVFNCLLLFLKYLPCFFGVWVTFLCIVWWGVTSTQVQLIFVFFFFIMHFFGCCNVHFWSNIQSEKYSGSIIWCCILNPLLCNVTILTLSFKSRAFKDFQSNVSYGIK